MFITQKRDHETKDINGIERVQNGVEQKDDRLGEHRIAIPKQGKAKPIPGKNQKRKGNSIETFKEENFNAVKCQKRGFNLGVT